MIVFFVQNLIPTLAYVYELRINELFLMKNSKYTHSEKVHKITDSEAIVPELVKLLNPKSVVDVGCGTGNFLYCFKKEGVTDILGLDGPWVNKEMLFKHISPEEFLEADFEKEIRLEKKFDLVVSLEVAEHLSASAADGFVKNLVNAGKMIVFSAAIPFQGGQNHLNEQWLTYWEEKFLTHEYECHDVLRPIFWDNDNIPYYYKQNMVLFCPKGYKFDKPVVYNPLKNVVHKDLYTRRAKKIAPLVNLYSKIKQFFGQY